MAGNRDGGDSATEDTERKSKLRDKLGLTTTEALDILQQDIERVLIDYEEDTKKNRYFF